MNGSGTTWRESAVRVSLVLGMTGVFGAAVALHLPGINGPWYWQLEWRNLPAFRTIGVTFLGHVLSNGVRRF